MYTSSAQLAFKEIACFLGSGPSPILGPAHLVDEEAEPREPMAAVAIGRLPLLRDSEPHP